MKFLRSIRGEIAGAIRSFRYDARRGGPHARTQIIYPEYDAYSRPPRRFLSATGAAALAVSGVAATYFLLAAGLSGVLVDPSTNEAPPNPFPVVTSSDGHNVVKAPPTSGSGGAPQPSPGPSPDLSPNPTGTAARGHTAKPKPGKTSPTKSHTSNPSSGPSGPQVPPGGGSMPPSKDPSPPGGSITGAPPAVRAPISSARL